MAEIKKPEESTYSYVDKNGYISVIDISSGKRLLVQKTLEDIFNDKVNRAQLHVLPTGEEVWIEVGMDLDNISSMESYKYSDVMADMICQKIREGGCITHFSGKGGIPPYSTICRWKKQNQEFNELLKEAKKDRAEYFMDQQIGIAEDAKDGLIDKDSVAASRLAMDGFERAAAAGDPAQFGKSKDQNVRVENLIIIDTGISRPTIRDVSSEQILEGKNEPDK